MGQFSIKWAEVNTQADSERNWAAELAEIADDIRSVKNNLRWKVAAEAGIKSRLAKASDRAEDCRKGMQQMNSALTNALYRYESSEKKILYYSDGKILLKDIGDMASKIAETVKPFVIPGIMGIAPGLARELLKETVGRWGIEDTGSDTYEDDGKYKVEYDASLEKGTFEHTWGISKTTASGNLVGGYAEAEFENHWNTQLGTLTGALGGSAGLGVYLAHGELENRIGTDALHLDTNIGATLGGADVSAEAGIKVGVDGGCEAKAELGAEAYVAKGDVSYKLGSDQVYAYADAEGALVGADASAGAGVKVTPEGVEASAKLEAEAYLAKGEIKGGYNLFGIDIGVSAEGMVGVQAEAGASVSAKGFEIDLGLGPIGGTLTVDASNFKLPTFDEVLEQFGF